VRILAKWTSASRETIRGKPRRLGEKYRPLARRIGEKLLIAETARGKHETVRGNTETNRGKEMNLCYLFCDA